MSPCMEILSAWVNYHYIMPARSLCRVKSRVPFVNLATNAALYEPTKRLAHLKGESEKY